MKTRLATCDALLLLAIRSAAAVSAGVLALVFVFVVVESWPALRHVGAVRFLADPTWRPQTQAAGGAFNLTLLPAPAEGEFDGVLKVSNTRVKDAPAIAALLNSVSVIGLFDEMAGQGIQFSQVDASFRMTPSVVKVNSSSAVGPSIGLSMYGNYDVASGRLDMRGVISPVYIINSIGAGLTPFPPAAGVSAAAAGCAASLQPASRSSKPLKQRRLL